MMHVMDPVDIIESDHRSVEALFREYEGHGPEAYEHKRETAGKIMDLLELHAEMEETMVYPRLLEAFPTDEDPKVEQAYAEHAVEKALIEELRGLPAEDPQFDAKMMVLKENAERHVEEEEMVILPKARVLLSETALQEMGEALTAFKGARGA